MQKTLNSLWSKWRESSKEERLTLLNERFMEYMDGDVEAVMLLDMVFRVVHIWDDLIDKDTPVSDDDINYAFWTTMIEIPRNGFYRDHQYHLTTLFQAYAKQWFTANKLEKHGGEEHKLYSFVLKELSIDLISQCAYFKGGVKKMMQVSDEMQDLLLSHKTFKEYISENK